MHKDNLAKMANQIASFFDAQSDETTAARAVASHLKLFWAPQMRRKLVDDVDNGHTETMSPVVIQAVHDHRSSLLMTSKHISGEERQLGHQGGGDAG
ncbi:MAG TPA: formate dehydrogenase subunit delta [Rhizobacter sp.]|nr:formate dehydrogenase subunit delta [Rhizobacter sp.]